MSLMFDGSQKIIFMLVLFCLKVKITFQGRSFFEFLFTILKWTPFSRPNPPKRREIWARRYVVERWARWTPELEAEHKPWFEVWPESSSVILDLEVQTAASRPS